MDLKALIAKMDQIEGKKFLTEATKTDKPWKDKSGKEADKEKKVKESAKPDFLDVDKDGNKKEPMKKAVADNKVKKSVKPDNTWKDKSGKKQSGAKVKGGKYTGKETAHKTKAKSKKVDEGINFKSSIANTLLREFGLEEADTANPWANDPAKSAAWAALTPEDQAWLGGGDPTDEFILARAPNKGVPAAPAMPGAIDPNNTRSARDASSATAAADLAAATAAEQPASTMGGPNPKMARFKELLDKAQGSMGKPAASKAPAAPATPAAPKAGGTAARPAFPTPNISGQNVRAAS